MAATNVIPFAQRRETREKSGSMESIDGYTRRMLNWRDAIIQQGKEEQRSWREFQDIEMYINYLDGEWWSAQRPGYRSSFYDNYLADQRIESLAALSDIRPVLNISSSVQAYEQAGKIIDKFTRHLWFHNNLDLKVVRWLDHALFGTGFMKSVAGYDNFQFSAHGPDQVMPVCCNEDIQEAAAVVYSAYKGLNYFHAKFPGKAQGLERQSIRLTRSLGQDKYARPESINKYTWDAMSPAMKRRMSLRGGPARESGNGTTPFPVVELVEIYVDDWTVNETDHDLFVSHPDLTKDQHNYHYIVPPGARIYPRKRLVIFGGDRLMYDGPSPFWHGLYPFTMLQLNPCVWSPGGIAKYRHLIPLCKSINRIGAGVDESIMRALNGNVVGRRGSMPEDVWDAIDPSKPGQKILMNPTAQPNDLKWMEPPQIPAYVSQFLQYAVDTVKRRSGSLDVTGLSRKKQAPGGEAVEQMRDAMSAPFRLEGRYLEVGLEQVGVQTCANITQYATVDKRIQVLGADGITHEDFDYRSGDVIPAGTPREDFWKAFSLKITPGSAHGSSRMQRKQEALIMHQRGALSTEGLYESTEFPAKWSVEKERLKAEHGEGIGVSPQKGRTPRGTRSQRNGGQT